MKRRTTSILLKGLRGENLQKIELDNDLFAVLIHDMRTATVMNPSYDAYTQYLIHMKYSEKYKLIEYRVKVKSSNVIETFIFKKTVEDIPDLADSKYEFDNFKRSLTTHFSCITISLDNIIRRIDDNIRSEDNYE